MAERNPNWTRDELILALDLYVRHRPAVLGNTSAEVIELSEVLNRLARADQNRSPTHRNPNGVAMKLLNFRPFDPACPLSPGLDPRGEPRPLGLVQLRAQARRSDLSPLVPPGCLGGAVLELCRRRREGGRSREWPGGGRLPDRRGQDPGDPAAGHGAALHDGLGRGVSA
jgi:hypothetical protein